MRDVNKEVVTSLYDTIYKVLDGKSVRVPRESIPRLSEKYSYRILDNFNIDKIDEYVVNTTGTGKISIKDLRKFTITDEYEVDDTLYPIVRKGLSHTGKRRSRMASKDKKGEMDTELFEINFTSLVPDIMYLLSNENFIPSVYYEKFTEEEIKDMNNLFISLMNKTLTDLEQEKLVKYFSRDKVTERFYRNMKEITPDTTKEYKHPNPLDIDLFDELTIIVEDEFDIIFAYIKSILLPIMTTILLRMDRHNSLNNKYKMMFRGISRYRVVVERDIKCTFSPTYSSGSGGVFKPELTVLKTLYRTKKEALEEIEQLSLDDFQDMINSQFGGIRAIEEVEKHLMEEREGLDIE